MDVYLSKKRIKRGVEIEISGSKSESNRLLVLSKLYGGVEVINISDSGDTELMKKGLEIEKGEVNVGDAGTVMRFLTAYFSVKEGSEVVLTGSERIRQRPVRELVEALKELGAEIEYLEKEGFVPIRISGKRLEGGRVKIRGDVSSQFITALMLVGGVMERGLEIEIDGECTSEPYINMSNELINESGGECFFDGKKVRVKYRKDTEKIHMRVESDWSSASYYYGLLACAEVGDEVRIRNFKENSYQGDSKVVEIYRNFGVETYFENGSILIRKERKYEGGVFEMDMKDTPDIAQTLVVSCFGMGVECRIKGLRTLKIKETDRILALKEEIERLGGEVEVTDESIRVKKCEKMREGVEILTYKDHRMAMSFSILRMKTSILIKNGEVVEKSYKKFWEDMERAFL